MERITITVEDSFDFLHWEVVRLDGEPIGVISKNTELDSDFGFRAFRIPSWPAKMEYEDRFCGYADTLIGAHNLAQAYANHLLSQGI